MSLLETTTSNEVSTATGDMKNLIGKSASDLIGFYGKAPVSQRASANQAAVGTTGATNSSPYGFTTAAQANDLVSRVNEIVATLTALGLWKGGA